MNRVRWKGPYVKYNLLKKINNFKLNSKINIKTISRDSIILPKFVGLTLRVYNGKTFANLKIIEEMIGYKKGEFVPKRKQFF